MQKQKFRRIGVSLLALALVPLAVMALYLRQPEPDPFQAAAIKHRPFPSLTYSVQGFFWWDTGYVGVQLDWVKMMSFNTIKQTFAWRDMEPERDVWTFHNADRLLEETSRRHLKVIAMPDASPPIKSGTNPISAANGAINHRTPPNTLNCCAYAARRFALPTRRRLSSQPG
jgi:hypothetical protein